LARGVVAAMAMTGMRTATGALGLLEQSPPDAIADEHANELIARLGLNREAAVELAHWAYGGLGGLAFGLLPAALRRHVWAGPVYGLGTWLAFELGVAPLLGLRHLQQKKVVSRVALAADHLLYGAVVARSTPQPD